MATRPTSPEPGATGAQSLSRTTMVWGAAIVTAGGPVFLRDPLRHPAHALDTARSPLLTLGDRVRLARLALRLATARWDGVRDVPATGRSAEQELRARTPGVYLGADAHAAASKVEQLLGGGQAALHAE